MQSNILIRVKTLSLLLALFASAYVQAQAPCQIGNCDPIGLPKEIKTINGMQTKDRPISGISFSFGIHNSDSHPVKDLSLSKEQVYHLNQLKGQESTHYLSKILAQYLNLHGGGGGKVWVNDIVTAYAKFGCLQIPLYYCSDYEPIVDIGRASYKINMKVEGGE